MGRRALLLALDNYAHSKLAKLLAPRNDVRRLREQLLALGYAETAISVHISSQHGALSTATLRTLIRNFMQSAQRGEELLLYLSGHGMDHDAARLIVPIDFDLDDLVEGTQLLSDHWIYGLARDAQADAVVVIADTCRSGAELTLKPARLSKGLVDDGPARTASTDAQADAPTVAMVYSCAKGRKSYATEGTDGESCFTQVLCSMLAPNQQVFTLGEIVDAVKRELAKAEPHLRQEPFMDERYAIPGRLGPPTGLVLKENEAARLRQRIGRSAWCHMLAGTPYWPQISSASPGLALQLQVLAVRAEAMLTEAVKHIPQDRWRSNAALHRLLEGFRHLLGDAPLDAPLGAILLAAPVVHEAILAGLVLRLAKAGPVLDPPLERDGPTAVALAARAWRNALDRDDDLERRRTHLRLRGAAQDVVDDLLAWQLWSFAYSAGEVWAYAPERAPGASGWLNDILDELLRPAPMPEVANDPRVMQLLEQRRLVRLARLLFVEPEDIDADASRAYGGLARKVQVGSGTQLWRMDEVEAAHLLSLAATLALDARRLPDLVADQLGLGDGFDLPALHHDLAQAAWQRADATLTLQLRTAFPATHAVLGALVEQAERHRHRLSLGDRVGPVLAARLPAAILDTALEPDTDEDNRPRFDTPHVRFSLDQPRVMRLLLGEKLYGDPMLALRELYQNAMDACRYRRARATLVARGKGKDPSYLGRIALSAGHRNQRPFISCRDNGVGMGDRHLNDLFARAGRRFTDAHEFHLDYAQWQESGVPFWPNSRFGIGVLSYFMLAEEILIETRRVETDGLARPDDGIEVRITGSGALFRIRRNPAVLDGEAGTSVTLFLKDAAADPHDVLRSVLDWLWLPEVETTIDVHDDLEVKVLQPGVPTATCLQILGGVLVPVPGTSSSLNHARLFWVPMPPLPSAPRIGDRPVPVVLVDGIRTAIDEKYQDHLHGTLLANLTEDLAGEVGVDRTKVRPPPTLGPWMRRAVDIDRGYALLQWPNADPVVLTGLAIARAQPIEQLDADLRAGIVAVADAPVVSVFGQAVSTLGIGLSIADKALRDSTKLRDRPWTTALSDSLLKLSPVLHPFVASRLAELQLAGIRLPSSLDELASYLRESGLFLSLSLAAQWPVQLVATRGQLPMMPSAFGALDGNARVDRLALGHVVYIATSFACSYGELARRVMPLSAARILDFEPSSLAQLDEAPRQTLAYIERVFKKGYPRRAATPIGWKDLYDSGLESAAALSNRLGEVRMLAELGFVSAGDMADLERLAPILAQAEARSLELDFDPRLLLCDRVGPLQLVDALPHRRGRPPVPGAVSATFMPWAESGLLPCAPALVGALDALNPPAAKLVTSLATPEANAAPDRFALLRQMLKQGCETEEVGGMLAELRGVQLIPEGLDVALFLEAFRSIQSQADLAKLIAEFDGELEAHFVSAMLPLGCSILLGLSGEGLVQALRPLQQAGIISIDLDFLANAPQLNQLLGVLATLSDSEGEESRWRTGIDSEVLYLVSVAMSIAPERLARIVEPLSTLGVVSADLDEFSKRHSPHRLAARLMSKDGDSAKPWRASLSAFELAVAAYEWKTPVRELAGALEDLALCGVDTADAQQFANWLAAHPLSSTDLGATF